MNFQSLYNLPDSTDPSFPLEQWNPSHCGSMPLRIKANGEWWHEQQLMTRTRLIHLFAKLLWLEEGQYFLKTPHEKIQIEVDDVPLFVYGIEKVQHQRMNYLHCLTTTGDIITVDAQHPIVMRCYQGQWRPYLHVRYGIYALIQRAAFFQLIALGELQETAQGDTILQLQSGDISFSLHSPSE